MIDVNSIVLYRWLFIGIAVLIVISLIYPFLKALFFTKDQRKQVFCCDCKHCMREENGDLEYARCKMFPKRDIEFLVQGPNIPQRQLLKYCSSCRIGFSHRKNCGKSGYHFEPIKTTKEIV